MDSTFIFQWDGLSSVCFFPLKGGFCRPYLVSGTPPGKGFQVLWQILVVKEVTSSLRLRWVGPSAQQGCPDPRGPGLRSSDWIGKALIEQGGLLCFSKKAIWGLSQIPWEWVVSQCQVPARYLKHKLTLLEPREAFAPLLGEKTILPASSEFHVGSLEVFSIYVTSLLRSPQCPPPPKDSKVPVLSFVLFPKGKQCQRARQAFLVSAKTRLMGEQNNQIGKLFWLHVLSFWWVVIVYGHKERLKRIVE